MCNRPTNHATKVFGVKGVKLINETLATLYPSQKLEIISATLGPNGHAMSQAERTQFLVDHERRVASKDPHRYKNS